jgi:hypothetical protein
VQYSTTKVNNDLGVFTLNGRITADIEDSYEYQLIEQDGQVLNIGD